MISCPALHKEKQTWWSIYFGPTHTDLISLSHSRLLAMTDVRSYLIRPVSPESDTRVEDTGDGDTIDLMVGMIF